MRNPLKGYTLVEIAIVIAIVGILAAMFYGILAGEGTSVQECLNDTRLFEVDSEWCIKEKLDSYYGTQWDEVQCYTTKQRAITVCETGKY